MKGKLMATIENAINEGRELVLSFAIGDITCGTVSFIPSAIDIGEISVNVYSERFDFSIDITDIEYDDFEDAFVFSNGESYIQLSAA